MGRKSINFLITIVCLLGIIFLNRGDILSSLYGYPYGINSLEREKYKIAEVNWDWNRFPKENKNSATQVWISDNFTQERNYYSKKIFMEQGLLNVSFEEDRYLTKLENDYQIDLVFRWSFDDNRLIKKETWIERVPKIDIQTHCYDWYKESELINKIGYEKADSLRSSMVKGTN